jgi:serine/threonine-protein kinase HipA
MCQALAVLPTRKYQNEGGPSVAAIVELLRTHSSERADDIETFIDAIGFNWLIAGTDAHAKNYSLLLSSGPRVRLAPLYDVASILPYAKFDMQKLKLSMKVGGEYRLRDVGLRQWRKLAEEVRIDEGRLIDRLVAMAERVPVAIADIRAAMRRDGLDQPVVERLEAGLAQRAKECGKALLAGERGNGAK